MAAAERKTQMSEEQAVNLIRNSLLVAGHEMGEGDHWPVIKATAHSIMKDYENWKAERNVFDEVKKHYEHMVKELRDLSEHCAEDSKPEIQATIVRLLEIYTAIFAPVNRADLYISEEDVGAHIKRAEAIMKTLEDDRG